ncbi:putative antigenic leucine-rich repeat protein [Yersinia pseudotuberculosis]|uniref:NEL-type E3 ubiquitin ligase domain-containing protein n=1 Tax=Yersinia pseudotuberculosis TaxID=633 RepID=UPI000F6F4086|nr:NEL-type E3 ubiquitin ligase domain-containing protein [Yersinia pseudotuberculosis]VEB10242.1 putative antigenic leucine-rich repeat protein [Yersinia pseudotuberculosis]
MNLSNITSNVSMPNIGPDHEIHADRAAATALTPADYHAIWEQWESEAIPGANEQRDQAVARMKECLENNAERLELNRLGLTSLPEIWPTSLSSLDLSDNVLTQFPQNLPEGMEDLTLSYNRQLQQGTSSLPSSLKFLDIVRCGFTELSEAITSLPITCQINMGQRGSSGYTHLIPENVRELLLDREMDRQVWMELGPYILRAREREVLLAQEAQQERPSPTINNLSDVIATWLPAEQQDKLAGNWATIEQEDNAPAFSAFLNRLADTVSAKENPEFILQVAIWLAQLAGSPTLREQTFLIAQEASATCEDRITLTYNDMQKAVMLHEVEKGQYDTQLPELMARGREMFRLEQLENIAREKVKILKTLNVHSVDDIEVCLAYQVKLRESLELFSVSKEMRFFGASHVTLGDLLSAEEWVKTAENQDFPRWLSQWSPWKSVVQRIEPERYAAAVEKQYHALENIYPDKLAAELAAKGMTGDVDANRIVGKRINDEIMGKIDMALTHEVLSAKGAISLLDSQWMEYI